MGCRHAAAALHRRGLQGSPPAAQAPSPCRVDPGAASTLPRLSLGQQTGRLDGRTRAHASSKQPLHLQPASFCSTHKSPLERCKHQNHPK